jgi:hypothetical protein
MGKSLAKAFMVLSIGLAALVLVALNAPTSGGGGKDKSTAKDKSTGKDTAKAKIDPEKFKPDPAKVKAQTEKAGAYYKEVFEVEKVPFFETSHFLIFGDAAGQSLVTIGGDLERAYLKACKVLELEKDPGPWPGKLTVFILPSSKRYAHMIRLTQRRKADEEENGCYHMEGMMPHVVVCPGKAPGDLGPNGTACTQLGAYLVSAKAKTPLPEWLAEGFGRATTLHVWPTSAMTSDRRKAAMFVTKNNRTVNDITSNNLKPEELPVLRASLMDYLAYSGRTAKLLPFLEGFYDDGQGNPGDLNRALQKAKMTAEELNNNWVKYAKSVK